MGKARLVLSGQRRDQERRRDPEVGKGWVSYEGRDRDIKPHSFA